MFMVEGNAKFYLEVSAGSKGIWSVAHLKTTTKVNVLLLLSPWIIGFKQPQ